MHVQGPQIYQMNHQTNSFQNMYGMLQANVDCLARKIDSLQKKHFLVGTNLGYLTLECPGRRTVDTKITSGVPLKTLGHDG